MAAHYSGDTGEYCQLTWLQSLFCCSVVKIISSCRPLIQYVYCRRVSRGGGPGPPLEIEKRKKKKKGFQILGPPWALLRIPGHAPGTVFYVSTNGINIILDSN